VRHEQAERMFRMAGDWAGEAWALRNRGNVEINLALLRLRRYRPAGECCRTTGYV
jgi:hypothetical protein